MNIQKYVHHLNLWEIKMTDNIMQGVWAAKDGIATECGHNPARLAQLLKEQQASSGAMVVDYHNRTRKMHSTKMTRHFGE